ncbi:MAG TPA: hypothetical protein VN032_01790, partial [Thermoanaerobaculia bacterium]|nr:hypothetical protein [Thermoanaerobaculia bacterium]
MKAHREGARRALSANRRSLLFLAKFLGLLVAFYALVAWNPINDAVIVPFTAGIARISAVLLNALGEKV